MSGCEPASVGPIMVAALLLVPLALPLAAAAWWAHRGRRAGALVALAISTIGLLAWSASVRAHPADPRWVPLLFVPPLAASGVVLLAPTPRARLTLLVCAAVPVLGGVVLAAMLWATAPRCG